MKRIIALLLIFGLMFSGCVSKKHKGDIGKIGKVYHNTTAHYNGYFNAEELLAKNKEVLINQEKDNFNSIIPVYAYTNATNRKAVGPDMDIAIKKVSVVINKHPYSDWTDDSYLLFAKAQFYKGDFEGAEETLQFLMKNYDPAKPKKGSKKKKKRKKKKKKKSKKKKKKSKKKSYKKKKKSKKKKWKKKSDIKKNSADKEKREAEEKIQKEKSLAKDKAQKTAQAQKEKEEKLKKETDAKNKGAKGNYIFKHRPCFQEAKLWLAKVKIERDAFSSAEFVLKQLENNNSTFDFIKREIPVVLADLYLRQEKFQKTVDALDNALSRTKKKRNRARYYFIQGQIYDKLDKTAEASNAYKMAIKMKPNYDMTFRAKLNNILNKRSIASITEAQADKILLKMTKDFKNYEYRDQIFFILAKSALQSNNEENAIKYLKESLAYNVNNNSQKAESYYLLADLYYKNESFVFSKNYFDSTLQVMPEADTRFIPTQRIAENLKDIARHITTIKEEGRWVEISRMSKEEQAKIGREILEKEREEKEKNKETKIANNAPKMDRLPRAVINNQKGGSTFFAYNPSDVESGKRSFNKKWGDRPLVDNWRRKSSISDFSNNEATEIVDNSESFEFTESEIAKVLANVPNTPEALVSSNEKIKDAYFYLGALFRDKLGKNKKCIFNEEKLNSLYPKSDKELDSWYYLYLAHTELNNTTTAKVYKDKIMAKYPKSTFGRVLLDPNYKGENTEDKLNAYYKNTYDLFSSSKYQEAMNEISNVEKTFGAVNPLGAKFALLNAMCQGNLKGKKDYISALNVVIAQYPDSAEEKRAKEIKRLLNGKMDKSGKPAKENKSKFKFNESKTHYCIVVFDEELKSFNNAKIAISDYNREYEKLLKLRISNIYLGADKKTSMIVIRKFKTLKKAELYIDGVNKNKDIFLPTEAKFNVYLMSQDNYRIILRNKSMDGYDGFYNNFYK